MPLLTSWIPLIHGIAARPPLVISGVRKIVQGVEWITDGEDWTGPDNFSFKDLSYSGKDNKLNQLERIYLNPGRVKEARAKLRQRLDDDRAQTSVGIYMKGDEKDPRSQGHCIQNIVVTHAFIPGGEVTSVDIFYRSTEAIKKFLADVLFLKKLVLPQILDGFPWPRVIRFYFANIYLSALFMPIYFRYAEPPMKIFSILEEKDPRFFRTAVSACGRFFESSHNYTYRERVKMYDYTHQYLSKGNIRTMRDFCRSRRAA